MTGIRLGVALGIVLATAGTLSANGSEFFAAGGGRGPMDLVYFGRIKDAETGRPIKEYAYVTVTDRTSGLRIPFAGDAPGHFRSPDIGAAVKELVGQPLDPATIEISVLVPGYRRAKVTRVPRKTAGLIEVDFRLLRETETGKVGVDPASPQAPPNPRSESAASRWTVLGAVIGGVVLLVVGAITAVAGRSSSSRWRSDSSRPDAPCG